MHLYIRHERFVLGSELFISISLPTLCVRFSCLLILTLGHLMDALLHSLSQLVVSCVVILACNSSYWFFWSPYLPKCWFSTSDGNGWLQVKAVFRAWLSHDSFDDSFVVIVLLHVILWMQVFTICWLDHNHHDREALHQGLLLLIWSLWSFNLMQS